MIHVLIADDHPVVRKGIRQILDATKDIRVVAEATDAEETIIEVATCGCHVVLLDLSMPGGDGLELIRECRRVSPDVPILVVTMHAEDQFAVRSLRAGAAGYLTKETAPSELIAAIRKLVAGGRYISPWLAERLAEDVAGAGRAPHERLSDREYQVFRMMASGKSTREIAAELSLSVKTIGTYRARIFEKMEMRTNAHLAAYAVRNRLVD